HHAAGEQARRVALHVARLDVPKDAAGEPGDVRQPVHDAVDHVFVEPVHTPREHVGEGGGTVDHSVDDVPVVPVDPARDVVSYRANDPLPVDVVDVELVRDERVRAAERPERIARLVVAVQDIADQDAPEGGERGQDGDPRHE